VTTLYSLTASLHDSSECIKREGNCNTIRCDVDFDFSNDALVGAMMCSLTTLPVSTDLDAQIVSVENRIANWHALRLCSGMNVSVLILLVGLVADADGFNSRLGGGLANVVSSQH